MKQNELGKATKLIILHIPLTLTLQTLFSLGLDILD